VKSVPRRRDIPSQREHSSGSSVLQRVPGEHGYDALTAQPVIRAIHKELPLGEQVGLRGEGPADQLERLHASRRSSPCQRSTSLRLVQLCGRVVDAQVFRALGQKRASRSTTLRKSTSIKSAARRSSPRFRCSYDFRTAPNHTAAD
jgi:hypothetical protein